MYRKLRMKLLLVPLVLLSSVTNAQLLWSYHNRSDSVHRTDTPLLDPSMVTLSVEKSSACAYDPVRILWRSADSDRLSEVLLSVSRSSSFSDSQMLTIPILSTVTTAGAAAHPMDSNDVTEADLPLIGLLRDPSVLPAVANVLTKPDLALLIVEFAEETTTPILADTASVLNACVFTPLLRGEATGTWTDSRTLQLRVSMDYLRVLLLAHKRGELIQIKPDLEKKKTADDLLKETVFGEVIVRPTEHGILRISAVDKYTLEEVSPVADVTVSLCEKDQLLPALHGRSIVETAPELTDTVPSPTRMTNLRGPFALTGNHAIKIVEEFSTALNEGSWSVSMWVKILEDPTGSHRTIFYKGKTDGGEERTPSAWLLPDQNRVAIRVSTRSAPDKGANSFSELPLNEWTNLAFVFKNSSLTSLSNVAQKEESMYYVQLYINGALDIEVKFNELVVGNDGPIHFFKDVSHQGFPGFLKDFSMWDQALSSEQVKSLYVQGIDTSAVEPVEKAVQLLQSTRNKVDSGGANSMIEVTTADVINSLMIKAAEARGSCASYESRLDLYTEAAGLGSAEALYLWSMMIRYGSEEPITSCGIGKASTYNSENDLDQERATLGFIAAASMGYASAFVPLSISLLTGLGINSLIQFHPELLKTLQIPAHRLNESAFDFIDAIRFYIKCGEYIERGMKAKEDLGGSIICQNQNRDNLAALSLGFVYVAAMAGVSEAHTILAYRYEHGIGVAMDIETAAQYSILPLAVAEETFYRVGGQPIAETDRINDDTVAEIQKGNQGEDDELIQNQILRAKEGHIPSMLAMGELYYYGARGMPRDQPLALQYFEQAANAGDPSGMCGAAGMYLKGEGVSKNVSHAVTLYENASSMGSVRALNGLGYIYFHGQALPQNHTKAYYYFLAAAETLTDGDALFNAAFLLDNGLGVERDTTKALNFYQIGAKQFGHFGCVSSLGSMYMEGRGVSRSPKLALTYLNAAKNIGPWIGWIRRGLDQYLTRFYGRSLCAYLHAGYLGYEVAQSNAAYILRTKSGNMNLLPSPQSTKEIAQKLPQIDGYREINSKQLATYELSPMVGSSGDSSLSEKIRFQQLKLSAFHGNKESALQLGHCYIRGTCGLVSYDASQAILWYTRAASLDFPLASLYLGVIYHFGIKETPINVVRANRYYDDALKSDKLDTQLQIMTNSLKYMLGMRSYSVFKPLSIGLDYVIQKLWGSL